MMNNQVIQKIREYIASRGFGDAAKPLNQLSSAVEFTLHYYTKKELQDFCRVAGVSTAGSKADLNKRIEIFLQTGKVATETVKRKVLVPDSEDGLSLDKQVINYKSDAATRAFLKKHIDEFKFIDVLFQKCTSMNLKALAL